MNKAQEAIYSIAFNAPPERHQLVWLTCTAWQHIESMPWDAQATEILVHWQAQPLPLMVTRQRMDAAPGQVCLGLPAPAQWGKRKLELQVDRQHLSVRTACPTLAEVAQPHNWRDAGLDLHAALMAQGVQSRVHGSYAWQHLTGLVYVHPSSDIDLHLNVENMDQAAWAVEQLVQAQLPQRLDGELIFSGGAAVAWREFAQLTQGKVAQVLLKDLRSVRLVTADDLHTLCATGTLA
ncbi:MAG: malonate decarboxylase holo-[acyl-carrier-protein] synthase [Rhodoferax sp.]|nr:malonate decarboxylase holo-[acyl-carrier-protein] synthase [Rhodoferax sp.]